MAGARDWTELLSSVEFAFQPIVNIHTGSCYAFEALARGIDRAGFATVDGMFRAAESDEELFRIDTLLREAALKKFAKAKLADRFHLFVNVDSRALDLGEELAHVLHSQALRFGIGTGSLIWEIAEREPSSFSGVRSKALLKIRELGFKVALDGLSGPQLWYGTEPEFIKINRAFLNDAAQDSRKKLFIGSIVNIAHMLGSMVVGEGLETPREFYACRELGCDLIQGHLIQRPTIALNELKIAYDVVENLSLTDRRKPPTDQPLIVQQLTSVPPIRSDAAMSEVFELFRVNPRNTFFPIVNPLNQPLGVVRETDIKQFVYSQYGKDLLKNKSMRGLLSGLIVRCPMADVNTPAEKILELFSVGREDEGLLIVQDLRYVGFLSASALLKIIHEKSLRAARDQNPLTRMPGNFVIYEYLSHAVCDEQSSYTLAYIDFDFFKPFNDAYGFRKGDRAITLFAELLKKELMRDGVFIGHIGGDDFFVGFRNASFDDVLADVRATVGRFRADMEGFYEPADRQRGSLRARDRDGNEREFPLLNASAALLVLPRHSQRLSVDDISKMIAELKKLAKASPERVAAASLRGPPPVVEQPPTIFIDPANNPALQKYETAPDRRRSTQAQKLPLGQFFDAKE